MICYMIILYYSIPRIQRAPGEPQDGPKRAAGGGPRAGPGERPGEPQEGPKRAPGGPQESPQDRSKRTQGLTRRAGRQAGKQARQAGKQACKPCMKADKSDGQASQASRQGGVKACRQTAARHHASMSSAGPTRPDKREGPRKPKG